MVGLVGDGWEDEWALQQIKKYLSFFAEPIQKDPPSTTQTDVPTQVLTLQEIAEKAVLDSSKEKGNFK